MNPFQILQVRGHIMSREVTATSPQRFGGNVNEADTSVTVMRRGTFTQAHDESAGIGKLSVRDTRTPTGLARSRSYGLVRESCIGCGVIRSPEGVTTHHKMCHAVILPNMDAYWKREVTGPLTKRETSKDTGWH